MTRDIIDINDFTILVEAVNSDKTIEESCLFDEPVIAVAFYGSGNVDLEFKYPTTSKFYNYTKGLALSFYCDEKVTCTHTVSKDSPLECIVIATATRNLYKLPNQEGELFSELLEQLVNPKDHYVEGPSFFMTPEMYEIVNSIFNMKWDIKAERFGSFKVENLISIF